MTTRFSTLASMAAALLAASLIALPAWAMEVAFKPVADGVYAYIGEIEGRTYDNEGLNANIGMVVTPAGTVLIDSGSSYQVAAKIHEAVRKVTTQPLKLVINSGEHMEGLKVLKERLDGTRPTLPSRFVKAQDSTIDMGGTVIELKHRQGSHTPGDTLVWLPQKNVLFSGDVVYVDRVLGLHPVSRTKTWLDSFAVIDQLKPQTIVPGHGNVTNLATAQAQTRDLLLALRAHMKQAVDDGVDISAAVKSFNGKPFAHLKHAEVWLPQLANQTYLEMERE